MQQSKNELTKVFDDFLEEYVIPKSASVADTEKTEFAEPPKKEIDKDREQKLISDFLASPCSCGKNCQSQFSADELSEVREQFGFLSGNEKNS